MLGPEGCPTCSRQALSGTAQQQETICIRQLARRILNILANVVFLHNGQQLPARSLLDERVNVHLLLPAREDVNAMTEAANLLQS